MTTLLVNRAELESMTDKERKALVRDGYVLQVIDAGGLEQQLTAQELKLLRAVVKGQSVSAAGAAIRVKRPRAFEIWNAIKAKLGVLTVQEARTVAAEQNMPEARKIAAE